MTITVGQRRERAGKDGREIGRRERGEREGEEREGERREKGMEVEVKGEKDYNEHC